MSVFSKEATFTEEHGSLNGSTLGITALHFTNDTILQIRLNGEMDSTFKVVKRGIDTLGDHVSRPIAGFASSREESIDQDDEFAFQDEQLKDNLADFQVTIKLGDPNNHKIPVICTQIAELFSSVLVPLLRSTTVGNNTPLNASNLTITMSSKIFTEKQEGANSDFGRLVFLLAQIKSMYE